jgi:hypothetical protein
VLVLGAGEGLTFFSAKVYKSSAVTLGRRGEEERERKRKRKKRLIFLSYERSVTFMKEEISSLLILFCLHQLILSLSLSVSLSLSTVPFLKPIIYPLSLLVEEQNRYRLA